MCEVIRKILNKFFEQQNLAIKCIATSLKKPSRILYKQSLLKLIINLSHAQILYWAWRSVPLLFCMLKNISWLMRLTPRLSDNKLNKRMMQKNKWKKLLKLKFVKVKISRKINFTLLRFKIKMELIMWYWLFDIKANCMLLEGNALIGIHWMRYRLEKRCKTRFFSMINWCVLIMGVLSIWSQEVLNTGQLTIIYQFLQWEKKAERSN